MNIMNNYYKLLTVLFVTIMMSFFSLSSLFAQEYHFASYNIRIDTAKGRHSWAVRAEPLCNLIAYNNFDIFGTQEVFYKQLKDMVRYFGDEYSYCGDISQEGKPNDGVFNIIFYKKNKFELIKNSCFWLSETPEKKSVSWGAPEPTICNWAYFKDKTNDKTVWFFNTHLSAKSGQARLESCKLIVKKIKEICPLNSNIVLTGDFNLPHTSIGLKPIRESGMFKDSYDSAKYKWTPTGTCPDGFSCEKITDYRIDFIWVSKNTEVSRYGILNNFYFSTENESITNLKKIDKELISQKKYKNYIPSDHYPISIWVSFPESSQK